MAGSTIATELPMRGGVWDVSVRNQTKQLEFLVNVYHCIIWPVYHITRDYLEDEENK